MKTINMNSELYKSYTISSLVSLGLVNNYKSHSLSRQKELLFKDAVRNGLIG
jgi:hypothetical protein